MGTQPLVCSVYCFLSCNFYVVIQNKKKKERNIHILDYGYYTYINAKFRHNKKSYVIVRCVHKNKTNPITQLILKIKDKDSIICTTLLLALDEFNKGKRKYIVSSKIAKKILNMVGAKYRGFYSIEVYTDGFYYETYDGKILLKIIKDKLPITCFNF